MEKELKAEIDAMKAATDAKLDAMKAEMKAANDAMMNMMSEMLKINEL